MTRAERDHQKALETQVVPWHSQTLREAFERTGSSEAGLTHAEAKARFEVDGPNRLPHTPPPGVWRIFLRQFRSPLIYILLLAAVVSLAISEFTDAAFILLVLVINALIGGYQEWRADRSSRELQKLLQVRAAALRDGEVRDLDAEFVVRGDMLWLESGNRVPADVRLVTTTGLEVDESLLTGESMAAEKDAGWTGEPETPLADRLNMAFAGTIVVRGRAKGLVVATGSETAVGQLALDVLAAPPGDPPLLLRMKRFTQAIALVFLVASIVVAVMGVMIQQRSIVDMFMFSVAMAVSAIPEGLPVALTVALAVAAHRMSRRGVIVRRLAAVEGLGSCTLIASDKTGTLTCNELMVRQVHLPDGTVFEVSGEGFTPRGQVTRQGKGIEPGEEPGLTAIVQAAVLCNEADLHARDDGGWTWRGDPTDIALLVLARKLGWHRESALERYPRVGEIPFEPERRYAASFHEAKGVRRVFVKGAPERVLSMCTGADDRPRWMAQAEKVAADGFRVLALAEGDAPQGLDLSRPPDLLPNLTFLGFVGMIDPLRPGVREAVSVCRQAGITTLMVTGDHPVTALAIARDLGLANRPEEVVTGDLLEGKSPEELLPIVEKARVFARVAPRQKLELVEAAQRAGHFVAVTGDGANDAPALRAANIGVAMGRGGTDVAREAAEMVLSDDNFATIVAGVEEGRVAYDNIRKEIYMVISTGAAEVLIVLIALGLGLPLPLTAVQFLWLNLVTNGIQDIALALEPGEQGILRRRPRSPEEPIFNRLMIERTIVAALVMSVICVAAFGWMLDRGWNVVSARNVVLLLMVLFQNIHLGNCRSESLSVFRLSPLTSPVLLAGAIGTQLLHLGMLYLPIGQELLHTEPVSARTWAVLLGLALSILLVMELHKWIWSLRPGVSTEEFTDDRARHHGGPRHRGGTGNDPG